MPDVEIARRLDRRGLVEHRGRYWKIADAGQTTASAGLLGAATADEIDGGFSDAESRFQRSFNELADRELCILDGRGSEWYRDGSVSYGYESALFTSDVPFRVGGIYVRMNADPPIVPPWNVTRGSVR